MRYVLLLYEDDAERVAKTEAEVATCVAYAEAMQKAGILVGGDRLRPAWTATTVHVAEGRTHLLDGPPGDRPGDPRAADPADHPRLRRRRSRLGLPGFAGHHGAAPGARQEEDPRGRDPVPGTRARRDARRDAQGEYVPLADQDPARWDARMIEEAEALLSRASRMPGTGRYQLEAAVQSAHVVRRLGGRSDWAAIVRIYDALLAMTGSPVVAINRAIAVAETRGPAAGLAALAALAPDRRLADYQPHWAARAGLLAQTGALEAAESAYERAIGLEADPAVRRFLQRRRAELRGGPGRSAGPG